MSLTKDHVLQIMSRYNNDPQQLIAILLDIQAASGRNFVEKKWAELAADVLKVPLSKIFDILTFYVMFSMEPRGEKVIEICNSTPCLLNNGAQIVRWFEESAGIKMGETTADGKITLAFTSCFGGCDIAPAAKIGDDVFGKLTLEKVQKLVEACIKGDDLGALCQN